MKKAENCLVSIIVPVYNTEKYLDRCIQSIVTQTYSNIEVLIIDDGSSDNSLNIAKKYQGSDQRVIVVSIPNGGVSNARNQGINLAKGEYVLFVDSDDYILPNFIQNMVNDSADVEYVVSNIVMRNPYKILPLYKDISFSFPIKGKHTIKSYVNMLSNLGISPLVGAPYCKLFRRVILIENDIRFNVNTCYAEDLEFNLSYLRYVNNVYISCNADYIYWKIIGNTLSRKKYDFEYLNNRWDTLFEYYENLFVSDNGDSDNRESIHRLGYNIQFSSIVQNGWKDSVRLLNVINNKVRTEKNIKAYTIFDLIKKKLLYYLRITALSIYRPIQRLVYSLRCRYSPLYVNY